MKICEACEFGECDWPDCELASDMPAVDTHHPDHNPRLVWAAWAGMAIISIAFWASLGWVVL